MTLTKITDGYNAHENFLSFEDKVQEALMRYPLTSGALAITGAGTTTAKTASIVYGMYDGSPVVFPAGTMAVLSGTVVNATFNVFVFSVNSAGTAVTTMGTAGATANAVVFPTLADGDWALGYVSINPTGTGNFVGGTDDLDDATIVPNAIYVNFTAPYFPAMKAI